MAISKNKTGISRELAEFNDTFSDSRPTSSDQLYRKILKVNFDSLRPIARRQIANLMRQYNYHPHRSIYILYINLIILDEKVFRNLNYSNLFTKKSE